MAEKSHVKPSTEVVDAGDGHDIVRPTHPYGVGIDTHKEFIQVCVLQQHGSEVRRYEREFQTSWPELLRAKEWASGLAFASTGCSDALRLRYTIESTGCYHIPVLLAWLGIPSVVNPVLAGATRRKTDVLDARLLAHHSLVGLWPKSFIPSRDGEVLRCLLAMRNEAVRGGTRCLNRINNHLLRFGHTVGREFSMADMHGRALVEDLVEGRIPISDCICPAGLPGAAKPIFRSSYALYDMHKKMAADYHKQAVQFIRDHRWPTGNGEVDGAELLKRLQTVPGVGEVSAITWLSVVCDPRRFEVPAQVAAFCGADPSLKVSAGKTTSHVKRKGNARLHHVLKNVASQLVRRHSEPLGQWGYTLMRRNAKGGWGRAINAVSRRLSIFLWHVHRTNFDFSFEQYRFMITPEVIDRGIDEMDIHQRYKQMLLDAGLTRTTEVAAAFFTTLPQQKGLGAGCLKEVKRWMEQNPKTPGKAAPAALSMNGQEPKPSKSSRRQPPRRRALLSLDSSSGALSPVVPVSK